MTDSESSCMDPFQGQMNIISRIIDKCDYSVFNRMSTPQMEAGSVRDVKTGKQLLHWSPMSVRYHRLQSCWNVQQWPQTFIILIELCNNLGKTKCSKRFSVEELRIYFNGKQLHSSIIWYFFSLFFGNRLSEFSIVPLWRHLLLT